MTDIKSIVKLNQLHPAIRHDAIIAYKEAVMKTDKNCHPVIDETLRSFKSQNELPPGVTKAKAGQSFHQYGLALDFHLVVDGIDVWDENNPNWLIVINCFRAAGFEWGGDWNSFKDYPHIQKPLGFKWQQLLALYNGNKFIPGNTYVNIT